MDGDKEMGEKRLKHHKVTFTISVDIYHDESLLPDEKWRKAYYSHIRDHESLAALLAYDMGIKNNYLGAVDGFIGQPDNLAYVTDVDIEDEDVKELPE
jgi:hypothetical protein